MAYRNQSAAYMLDIEIKSKDLQIDTSENGLLGRGGYGSVYIGKHKGESVAVKMLSDNGIIPKTQRNDLRKEAKKLRAVCEHPFILTLIGVVMEPNNYSLVLEYMHFGTSISFIKKYIVGVPVRVQFAYQIISAMSWLHSQNPPMKHLDLKAENVLINNNFIAKISDFGLSEWKTVTMAISKTQQLSQKGPRCGTLSHIPPEVFRDINKKGTMEEDVYAFAITLWEIFSGLIPYAMCGNREDLIRGAVLNNQRPDLKSLHVDCPREIQNMIQVSWDHNPMFRPTFKDLKEKIEPVFNRVKDTLTDHFKYIRAQIVTNYQNDSEEEEHYQCTMHWSCNGNELSNGHGGEGDDSCDAKPSTNNGSFNIEYENRQIAELNSARNTLTNEGTNMTTTEQEDGDGYKTEVNYPPTVQANGSETSDRENSQTLVQRFSMRPGDTDAQRRTQTGHAAVRPLLRTEQTQIANGKPDQYTNRQLGNNIQAHVPISETNQVENFPVTHTNIKPNVGLSGFVSVNNKQYTPGSQLSHPHGPIAQPASTVLENEPVANGNLQVLGQGEGRNGEEGEDDDDDKLFQGDSVLEQLMLNLSVSNPALYESLLSNPDALSNIARISNGGQLAAESRPSETVQRPPNSCTREVTPTAGTQLLTQLTVDQFSGQSPSGQRQGDSQQQMTQHLVSQQQQTAILGATANSVRMHRAPDRASNQASAQSSRQPVVTTVPGQTAQQKAAFATPPVHLTQQKLPRQPVMQNVRPFQVAPKQILGQQIPKTVPQNQIPAVTQSSPAFQYTGIGSPYHQLVTGTGSKPTFTTVFPQSTQQPSGMQGQATNMHPPQVPLGPAQSFLQQNVGANQQNVLPRRPASPVEARNQIRPGETSSRSDQQAANQANTSMPDSVLNETSEANSSGRKKQPVTIYHKHAGGGVTTIQMDPDHELPPNLQIGNKNVMVVNDNGGRKKSDKKKKQKCKKSDLTTSTAELSMDHIDMVAIEIGKDWKRLCRQLDMTEADIEHLQFDYYSSGLYEIMYQGIQRWIQRNGRAANVRLMAEALWEIDRDDIALRMK